MKKIALIAILLTCSLTLAADNPAETISLSSSSAVVSTLKYGGLQMGVQCDGEVRYQACRDATCTVGLATSTSARLTNFDLPVDLCIPSNTPYVSFIRTGSTTVTCYLYVVDPKTICR